MASLPLRTVVLFVASAAFQILAVALLPRTRGFTLPLPTVACAVLFVLGIWMFARLYEGGAKLGIISPLLAAVIPLAVVGIGIFAYGESASPLRVALLVGACVLIGVAATVQ